MFTLPRILKHGALLIAGAVAVIGFAPGTASASFADCPAGDKVCVFQEINGGLPMYYYTLNSGISFNVCVEIRGSWEDNISSVYNKTPYILQTFNSRYCAGAPYPTNPNTARNFLPPYDNAISSMKLVLPPL